MGKNMETRKGTRKAELALQDKETNMGKTGFDTMPGNCKLNTAANARELVQDWPVRKGKTAEEKGTRKRGLSIQDEGTNMGKNMGTRKRGLALQDKGVRKRGLAIQDEGTRKGKKAKAKVPDMARLEADLRVVDDGLKSRMEYCMITDHEIAALKNVMAAARQALGKVR